MKSTYKLFLFTLLLGAVLTSLTQAQSFILGDVTANLPDTIFIDDASTGGGDNTIHDSSGQTAIGLRTFNFPTGQAGTITFTGFGFATSGATAANDATSIDIEFVYMGADGVNGGTDDLSIGSVSGISYNHGGNAGEYYVDFGGSSISGSIDAVTSNFRVLVTVNDLDGGLQESIRFKTQTGLGVKYSVSGTFTAVPEPSTYALGFGLLALGFVFYRRKR